MEVIRMSQDEHTENNQQATQEPEKKRYFDRRDILKGLATIPVVGFFFAKLYKSWLLVSMQKSQSERLLSDLGLNGAAPAVLPSGTLKKSGQLLRLGIIGCGSRGEYLLRAAGFAHPTWLESMKKAAIENKLDKRYEDFINQDDLNIVFNGICDVFDVRAESALETVRKGSNKGKENKTAKRYRRYKDMLESDDIDAVIVATPEHWHAQMAIDAAGAGKHL